MIRKFENKDLDVIMEIWLNVNVLAHDFIPAEYWEGNFNLVRGMLPKAEIYVYESGDKVEGFIGVDAGYIAGIFVLKENQSKGIGKKLLDRIKGSYSELSLSVYKNNIKAIKFYQREHFIISKQQVDENTSEIEYFMIWNK